MRRLFAIVLVLMFARLPLAHGAAPIDSNPEQVQIDAYMAVVRGDQARDRADWKESLRAYHDALTFYKRLAEEHAEWHPEIVQYRLTYCANEIASIQHRTGKTEAEIMASSITPPPVVTNDAQREVLELQSQNDALREEIKRLNAELQARPVADSWEAENKRLKEESVDLRAQLAAFSNNLAQAAASTNRSAVAAAKSESEGLRQELANEKKRSAALLETISLNEAELKKVADLRKRIDTLKTEKDKIYDDFVKAKTDLDRALQEKRVEKMEALVKDLRAQLEASQAKTASINDEKEKLQGAFDKTKADLDKALQEKRVEKLEAQVKDLRAQLETSQAKVAKLGDEKDKLAGDVAKAKADLDKALQEKRVEKLEALVKDLRAQLEASQAKVEDLSGRLSSAEKENYFLKKSR